MLNPSQADAERDDPTIRACSQFAQRWGYHQLNIVNLFAYRTPHPSNLQQTSEPIGPDNDHYLLQATESANKVILAWGKIGRAHVWTPVTRPDLVCRLLLEKKKNKKKNINTWN